MIGVIIAATVFGLFIGQYFIGKSGAPNILGAILPALWIVAVIVIAANGQMTSFRDYVIAVIGFFVALALLGGGQKAREEKISKESRKIDNYRDAKQK